MARPLPRDFFDRPTEEVARELVGCRIVREKDGAQLLAEIVETEAYVGPEDLACHASRGRTARTEVMFGPPGHAYVYLCYGLHWLLNVVTMPAGHASAVLLRAARPCEGLPEGARLHGPARLTKALGIDGAQNRLDLTKPSALFLAPRTGPAPSLCSGPRIGVAYAGPTWAAAPLRFWARGSPFVSVAPKGARLARPRREVVQARRQR